MQEQNYKTLTKTWAITMNMKNTRARCAYPWHRPTGCVDNNFSACHIFETGLYVYTQFRCHFRCLSLKETKQVVIVICRRLTWALGMILVSKLLCTLKKQSVEETSKLVQLLSRAGLVCKPIPS